MSKDEISVEALSVSHIMDCPVWEYTNEESGGDEMAIRPVRMLPASDLDGKIVGTKVRLANGEEVWATLGNVDIANARRTQHFLVVSVERDGTWFHLARYFDFDYTSRGPEALAAYLGLSVDEVFPITYDIRDLSNGDPAALAAAVLKEPRERLSRAERIALSVP